MSSMLVRISIPGQSAHGGPNPVPNYGDQLQNRANVGIKAEGDVYVSFEENPGTYPDGTAFSLLSPKYNFVNLSYGELPADVMLSGRVAPQIVGLGLLEAIPEKAILALAKPDAKDGVSGRANMVWDLRANKKRLGRFGWKSNQPSIMQQNAGALAGDMGITSTIFPEIGCATIAEDCRVAPSLPGPEIEDDDLVRMDTYVKLLAVPTRRNLKDPTVKEGQAHFNAAGCQSCHVATFVTGKVAKFPELSHQRIFPYTDLLVHDMGEGLADHRPDFEATGVEWRTAPLWSVGLIPVVNDHSRLLHDGRARTIEEAILWHGGEAEASKKVFMALPLSERKKVIHFVESL